MLSRQNYHVKIDTELQFNDTVKQLSYIFTDGNVVDLIDGLLALNLNVKNDTTIWLVKVKKNETVLNTNVFQMIHYSPITPVKPLTDYTFCHL